MFDAPPVPDQLPVLSRGKHRNPRKGACFMEFASYLAGERWSDHPACTHPLLASLARGVNDCTSDEARPRLARHIPTVIGLVGEDPRIDVQVALAVARTALPVVAAERQRALAVGLLAGEQVMARIEQRAEPSLSQSTLDALAQAPGATRWAEGFSGAERVSVRRFRRYAAPSIVSCAVKGVALACIADPDRQLEALLVAGITACHEVLRPAEEPPATADPTAWTRACALTGTAG